METLIRTRNRTKNRFGPHSSTKYGVLERVLPVEAHYELQNVN